MSRPSSPHPTGNILVVDDDELVASLAATMLQKDGHRVTICDNGAKALAILGQEAFDLVLLDVFMPNMDGKQTFLRMRQPPLNLKTPVIFVTLLDDAKTVNWIFDNGAADYIGKPVRPHELVARVRLHLTLQRQGSEIADAMVQVSQLRDSFFSPQLKHPDAFAHVLTKDNGMKMIFRYIEAVAGSARPVLISGETGVGKGVIAEVIHTLSGRQGNFVSVNVAGLDDNLFSDTLFGHKKGAFTGAIGDRRGLIESAQGGTLFLDEIGDLPIPAQVKLLRLLQEHDYYQLGSDQPKFSDARVVLSTHQNLQQMVHQGTFREDLYYRVRTHRVELPPLRQRPTDIPLLLNHFIAVAAQDTGLETPTLPDDLISAVCEHEFPGNVRELDALAHDIVSCSQVESLSREMIAERLGLTPVRATAQSCVEAAGDCVLNFDRHALPTLKEINELLIRKALERSGNQTEAARILGISRQALNKRLNQERAAQS